MLPALVPVDYKPGVIYPIPDRTVAALINGISKEHGNNIVSKALSRLPSAARSIFNAETHRVADRHL